MKTWYKSATNGGPDPLVRPPLRPEKKAPSSTHRISKLLIPQCAKLKPILASFAPAPESIPPKSMSFPTTNSAHPHTHTSPQPGRPHQASTRLFTSTPSPSQSIQHSTSPPHPAPHSLLYPTPSPSHHCTTLKAFPTLHRPSTPPPYMDLPHPKTGLWEEKRRHHVRLQKFQ